MQRGEGVGVKKGESSLASNQFPVFSPQSGTLREVHGVQERRETGGRKEIEVTRRKGGGVKRRETSLACDQFPKFSPQPEIPKEIHKVGKRRGREEVEVTWGRKKKSKVERALKPVITLLSKNGY